jgi:hypothetical protein
VCEDKTVFLFPTADCFMAPIVHSTVEEIALYMYGRIVEGIGDDYLKERNVREMVLKISEVSQKVGGTLTLTWESSLSRQT